MRHIISTYEACEAYQQEVYDAFYCDDIGTERWATPRKNPVRDEWTVPVHPEFETELPTVETLPADWNPETEEPV